MSVTRHWLASLVVVVGLLCLPRPCHAQLRVEAVFNQRGVRGSIEFSQDSPQSSTSITVNLTGIYYIL